MIAQAAGFMKGTNHHIYTTKLWGIMIHMRPFSILLLAAVSLAAFPAAAQTIIRAPMQQGSQVQLPGAPDKDREAMKAMEKALENLVVTEGQIEVVAPPQGLKLGEVNELTLLTKSPGLVSVFTHQGRPNALPNTDRIEGGDQELPVLHRPDGTAYIRLVPMELGDIEMGIMGNFAGKQLDRSTAKLHVGLSSRKPVEIWIDPNGFALQQNIIRLDIDEPRWAGKTNEAWQYLFPVAFYPDVRSHVYLDVASVEFKVRQPAGAPVIAFDRSTGRMKPLRQGDALVETWFSGVVRRTCIQVRNSSMPFDRSNCKQLRAAAAPSQPSPLNTTWSQDPDGLASEYISPTTEFFTDRLKVTAPDRPVELGQPIEIPLEISGGKLRRLNYSQRRSGVDAEPIGSNEPAPAKVALANKARFADNRSLLEPDENGAYRGEAGAASDDPKSIEIVPLAVGEETVAIVASFQDHGVSTKYFRLRVLPAAPKR